MSTDKFKKYYPLLLHTVLFLPVLALTIQFFLGGEINPIQTLEKRSGDIALVLLLASLACTPLRLITRKPVFARLRRPLGLYAFAYAGIHFLVFIALDYTFLWTEIFNQLKQKFYLWVGLGALILLFALALTSIKSLQSRLKKLWSPLHRLVYLAAILAVIHFGLSAKGSFFSLRGQIFWQLLALVVLLILLGVRAFFFYFEGPRASREKLITVNHKPSEKNED